MRGIILYLMASATVVMTACEKENNDSGSESGIKHYFGDIVEIEIEEDNATIVAIMPSMTVDGHDNPKAEIKLGYEARMGDLVGEEQFQSEYGVRDSLVIFKLTKLAPMTEYDARIYIEDERYNYTAVSEEFTFHTAKRDPQCDFEYDLDIKTRGLFATITMENISYTADGKPHPLRSIELEYRRHGYFNEECVKVEYDAEDIVDGRLVMELPAQGHDYLDYSTNYEYTIRIWPEQSIIPEEPVYKNVVLKGEFTTTNAEIKVEFSTPVLSYEIFDELEGAENVGDSRITAQIERIDIFYDGVPSKDYNPEYRIFYEVIQLCYRQKGAEEWQCQPISLSETGGAVSRFILDNPETDTIYEVCFAVFAGSDHSVGHHSDIVEINVNPSSANI